MGSAGIDNGTSLSQCGWPDIYLVRQLGPERDKIHAALSSWFVDDAAGWFRIAVSQERDRCRVIVDLSTDCSGCRGLICKCRRPVSKRLVKDRTGRSNRPAGACLFRSEFRPAAPIRDQGKGNLERQRGNQRPPRQVPGSGRSRGRPPGYSILWALRREMKGRMPLICNAGWGSASGNTRPASVALAGKPIWLRFVMKDADLYCLRFRD